MKYGILGVLFVTMVLAFSGLVEARSGYLSTFNGLYGTSGTRIDSCDTCHVPGSKSRNSYGLAVEAKLLAGNTTSQALTAIEPLDSDGDTFNNITEINGLTFPGDPNDKPGAAPAPAISLNPTSFNFGPVTIGNLVTKTTVIQNTGNAGLNVTAIALGAGTSTEYTSFPAAPFTVAAGSSTTLSVTYSPVDTTTDSGSLQITSNDTANPTASLGLTGSGVAPQPQMISLSPTSLDFGAVTTGSSVTRTALIQNTGSANLDVTAIALGAGTSTEYTSSPAAPFTVAGGSSTTLSVTYSPVDITVDSGSLQITSNDATNPTVSLNVTGSGVAPQPQVIDIDITGLTATARVALSRVKPVALSLSVTNPGTLSSGTGLVTATLVGTENSVQIYSQTIALDNIGIGATASFTFPAYTPTVIGTITWAVTVIDQDADVDQATAVTKIVK